MSKDSISSNEVKKIVLACEAGMGSSLMVKNGLIKKLEKVGLDIEVEHSPVNLIPADADVVVAHQGLSGRAREVAENSVVISFNMFMNDPAINKLVDDLSQGNDIHSA
tara:strand:- start:1945 stop:2268 length:324 start_codon:yes stop_codon:yes gene_type:complete